MIDESSRDAREIGAAQVGLRKRRAPELGAAQDGAAELCAVELRPHLPASGVEATLGVGGERRRTPTV